MLRHIPARLAPFLPTAPNLQQSSLVLGAREAEARWFNVRDVRYVAVLGRYSTRALQGKLPRTDAVHLRPAHSTTAHCPR